MRKKTNMETNLNTKKTYHEVYFRIDTGYLWGKGLEESKTQAFYDEIMLAFLHRKWAIEPVGTFADHVCYAVKGKTRLYIHPMELTGPCEDSLVSEVEGILAECKTLEHYDTDVFEELYELEGDELEAEYHKNDPEVDKAILKAFVPTKAKKAFRPGTLLFGISDRFKIPTLKERLGIRTNTDSASRYVQSRFNALVKEGFIEDAGDGLYRTYIKKT